MARPNCGPVLDADGNNEPEYCACGCSAYDPCCRRDCSHEDNWKSVPWVPVPGEFVWIRIGVHAVPGRVFDEYACDDKWIVKYTLPSGRRTSDAFRLGKLRPMSPLEILAEQAE